MQDGKPPFRLKDSYPDSSTDLLATSRLLNNKRRRFPRKDKRQMKSTTSLNFRNKERSIETSKTCQESLTTAHLQHESTDRVRESTGREIARESTGAREVISAAAARRRQP